MKRATTINPRAMTNEKMAFNAGFQDALNGRPMQADRFPDPSYQQKYEDGYAKAIELERRHSK